MATTIKDIAKKANVSIATVSRVINHKEEGISQKTRKRILKIIEEENYQPNRIARSMITKKTSTIGLIIPDITNPFFPEMVRGIEDFLHNNGFSVFLCNSDGNVEQELQYLQLMREKNVDGLLYTYSYNSVDERIDSLLNKNNIPTVMLDRGKENIKYSGVYIDNEAAGYTATKHLLELSHKHIGCITGPTSIQNSKDRVNGYKRALQEFGISINENYIKVGDYQMKGGYHCSKELLSNPKISAIFALNDLMAFGVYQAASELGKSIPDDLSIVGFDNLKYNQVLSPKLTTVEQSTYEMGKSAAHLILKQIENKDKSEVKSIFLKTKLIIRDSSKQL